MLIELQHKAAGPTGKKPTRWEEFCQHHDLSKGMLDDKKLVRYGFPRKHVFVIEDFSQDGSFTVVKEHHSRYYESHSYTLFGIVVHSHVEDRLDLTGPEKKELIGMMEKHNPTPDGTGPHILTEMHIVLTADNLHDPAAVMHFNSEILIPYLQDNVHGFASGKGVMHLHTDGAPNQFHCKDIYYWTSRCKARYNVLCDWCIGCAAHGKDTSDGECGVVKNMVDRVNLAFDPGSPDTARHVCIQTVEEVHEYLKEHGQPKQALAQKHGVGIWRRVFHLVKLKEICRRIPTFDKGIEGSKSFHQYVDTGKPGQLLVRKRPCHVCECCMKLDWKKMTAAKDAGVLYCAAAALHITSLHFTALPCPLSVPPSLQVAVSTRTGVASRSSWL